MITKVWCHSEIDSENEIVEVTFKIPKSDYEKVSTFIYNLNDTIEIEYIYFKDSTKSRNEIVNILCQYFRENIPEMIDPFEVAIGFTTRQAKELNQKFGKLQLPKKNVKEIEELGFVLNKETKCEI